MTKLIVTYENIDNLIEEWHTGSSEMTLHEYLGLTFEEYGEWVNNKVLPIRRQYKIGDKVIPVSKTPRIREHDNCATFYQRHEMNQDYLYVVGFDEEEEKRLGKPCYWCNVNSYMGGDSFAELDLILYKEDGEDNPVYKVIGTKISIDNKGHAHTTEVRDYKNMSQEDMEDMMQVMTITNEKGKEEVIDLRYL